MDRLTDFQNIKASHLGARDKVESFKKVNANQDIESQLLDISEKVEKAVEVNLNLQEKISVLGEAIVNLAEDIKKIAEALSSKTAVGLTPKEPLEEETELGLPAIPPSPFESDEENVQEEKEEAEEPKQKRGGFSDMVNEIRKLTDNNMELVKTLKNIDTKLEKGGREEKIKKALEKVGI